MDLFLHIGTEKTGTSSIQRFLVNNIDKLKKKKIHFSKLIDYPNNRHLVEMFIGHSDRNDSYHLRHKFFKADDKKIFLLNLKSKFEKEIMQESLVSNKMIITSEHFHSLLKDIDQIKSLKKFLNKFFNKIKIICYFREQGKLAISYYSTTLKGGSQLTLKDFIEKRVNINDPYFNYYEFLKKWSDVFGKENIMPSIFEFEQSDDEILIADFLKKIDSKLIITEFIKKNLKINTAIHPQARKYFYSTNIVHPKIKNIKEINNEVLQKKEIKNLILTKINKAAANLPVYDTDYKIKIAIYKKFYDINVNFFWEFFNKKKNLFEPPIESQLNEQEIIKNEELLLINFLSLISKEIQLKKVTSQESKKKTEGTEKSFTNLFKNNTDILVNSSHIYNLYEYIFKKKLQLEIILENILLAENFCIISKDLNKLTVKLNLSFQLRLKRLTLWRLITVIKICEFTKNFKNAIFSLGDGHVDNFSERIITFCSNNNKDLLIPDYNFVGNFFKVISELNNLPEIKSKLAVFCGNITGLDTSRDRYRLFNFGINNENILKLFLIKKPDILRKLNEGQITHFQKFFIRDRNFFEMSKNQLFHRIPLKKMYFFLVQVDVDGVTNSFPSFFHKLYSGRPLLKIRSSLGYRQWYYDRLTPDYHYFDVKSDLSNFKEKYYQALEQSKTTKVFPGREFICKMNYDEELKLAADKISFYFKY